MHFNLATSRLRVLKFFAVLLVVLALSPSVFGQPGILIFGGPLPQAELSEPRIEMVSGPLAARLDQARALAAAKNWDEAVDIYRELASDSTDRVVAIDGSRYINLNTYCQMQLAKLPADGLAAYRRRVDSVAEHWYREGMAARDEPKLRRVATEFFCSSWGDDALLVLGELALDRADYAGARRAWEQMNPLLRDPNGRSLWQALHGFDLKAKWVEIDRRWNERTAPPTWLAYPDSLYELAQIRAWLILVSTRAGDFDRASLELEAFRNWHPQAEGRLGGQKVVLSTALEKLLASARDWKPDPAPMKWPTFAGSQSRDAIVAPLPPDLMPLWDRPVELVPPPFARRLVRSPQSAAPTENPREAGRPLSCFPVVHGQQVLFADSNVVRAVELASGKPAITTDGVIYRNESTEPERQVGQFPLVAEAGVSIGVPRLTLNVIDEIVFTRVGTLPTSHAELPTRSSGDRLVGLDLRREGLLTFHAKPEDAAWAFDGTPVGDGERVFVAMRHNGATPQAAVACFDASTGNQLWRTPIVAADTPAGNLGDEITHNLLTLVGDRIYFSTNLGVVAAIDTNGGKVCWLYKYQRWVGKSFSPGATMPPFFERDPSPCLYADGVVFAAPADSPAILVLDADTGVLLWSCDQLADALHLLGVTKQHLIVSGNRLASLDRFSGKIKWIWPESQTAGIRGMGRGLIAGNDVFWPTRTEIYAVDAETGARTRSPVSLSPVGNGGANLSAVEGRLLVAGYDKLLAYGPPPASPQTEKPSNTENAPQTGRFSDSLPLQTKAK
jgi:outer membrane protein assembly factor BamB